MCNSHVRAEGQTVLWGGAINNDFHRHNLKLCRGCSFLAIVLLLLLCSGLEDFFNLGNLDVVVAAAPADNGDNSNDGK